MSNAESEGTVAEAVPDRIFTAKARELANLYSEALPEGRYRSLEEIAGLLDTTVEVLKRRIHYLHSARGLPRRPADFSGDPQGVQPVRAKRRMKRSAKRPDEPADEEAPELEDLKEDTFEQEFFSAPEKEKPYASKAAAALEYRSSTCLWPLNPDNPLEMKRILEINPEWTPRSPMQFCCVPLEREAARKKGLHLRNYCPQHHMLAYTRLPSKSDGRKRLSSPDIETNAADEADQEKPVMDSQAPPDEPANPCAEQLMLGDDHA